MLLLRIYFKKLDYQKFRLISFSIIHNFKDIKMTIAITGATSMLGVATIKLE